MKVFVENGAIADAARRPVTRLAGTGRRAKGERSSGSAGGWAPGPLQHRKQRARLSSRPSVLRDPMLCVDSTVSPLVPCQSGRCRCSRRCPMPMGNAARSSVGGKRAPAREKCRYAAKNLSRCSMAQTCRIMPGHLYLFGTQGEGGGWIRGFRLRGWPSERRPGWE